MGIVFDIQRCSIYDGPGIRTTVFLKGCPLRCIWCHNPESHGLKPQIYVNMKKCRYCRLCDSVCENECHKVTVGSHHFESDNCVLCKRCKENCSYDAIEIKGMEMSVDDVIEEVEKDMCYYQISGGGMTLSGGEPLFQYEFSLAVLKRCKEMGIHTCIETCGYTSTAKMEAIMPYMDLFLFDYKATGPSKHRELTGVDNDLILRNLELLHSHNANIILRCPLIPGVNDHEYHLKTIAEMKVTYPNIQSIEIMPYHNLGVNKLKAIGQKQVFEKQDNCSEDIKEQWHNILLKYGNDDIKIN